MPWSTRNCTNSVSTSNTSTSRISKWRPWSLSLVLIQTPKVNTVEISSPRSWSWIPSLNSSFREVCFDSFRLPSKCPLLDHDSSAQLATALSNIVQKPFCNGHNKKWWCNYLYERFRGCPGLSFSSNTNIHSTQNEQIAVPSTKKLIYEGLRKNALNERTCPDVVWNAPLALPYIHKDAVFKAPFGAT